MRVEEVRLGAPAVAQTVDHDVVVGARREHERVRLLEFLDPGVRVADGVVHVPQLRVHLGDHGNAVAGVERPTVEPAHGIAAQVLLLHVLVEFEPAQREDDAFARLDGLRRLVVTDERVRAYDLLGFGVLDELFVVAAEHDLDAQVGADLVELLPEAVAVVAHRAHVHGLGAFDVGILHAQVAGGSVRALLDLRVDAPVVAVVKVVVAFLGPGACQILGRPAQAEAGDVLGGLFHVVHPGELAHVDGRVAAAARRCLLQHQHVGLAFVERGQRSPQAGASVSDDQHVGLVVPCSRHPVGCGRVLLACVGRGAAGKRSRCYRSCRRNACPFEEVAP